MFGLGAHKSSTQYPVQMHHFWRPSAWADYLHAYTPQDCMLLDTSVHNFPLPVLMDPAKLQALGFMFYVAFRSEFGRLWKVAAFTAVVIFGTIVTQMGIRSTLRRHLDLSAGRAPSSTQRLLRHLLQLDDALAVIQEHVCQRLSQTGRLPSASSIGQTASGVVLMHAGRKHASIKGKLMARLEAACLTCLKQRRVSMPLQTEMDAFDNIIDAWESLMRTHPFDAF